MQTNTKQEDLSNGQNFTETKDNLNSFKGAAEKIEDSIFGVVNIPQSGWAVTIGNNLITAPRPTREEALASIEELSKETWNIIFKMVCIVTEHANRVDRGDEG